MENSVDALKIAFAIIIFVVALTISFNAISVAKSTADMFIYTSDETNYYDYNSNDDAQIVDFSTLVATINNYYTETISVIVKDTGGSLIALFDSEVEKKQGNSAVWIGSTDQFKKRIECTITGEDLNINGFEINGTYNVTLSEDGIYTDLTSNNTLAREELSRYKDDSFRVTFEERQYSGIYNGTDKYQTIEGHAIEDDGSKIQITPGGTKVYITFTLIREV